MNVLIALLMLANPESGDDASPGPRYFAGQRNLGIIADVGVYSGVAAGVQVGTPTFGVHGTFGWMPVFISAVDFGESTSAFKFFNSAQAGADLYALPFATSDVADIGGSLGYRYNTLLGHGVGVAFQGRVDLNATFAIHIIGGVTVYPDGEDRILRDNRELSSADYLFGGAINAGANLGLIIFP